MTESSRQPSRREAIRMGLAAGMGLSIGRLPLSGQPLEMLEYQAQLPLVTKPIPSTGERLPVVGIGTNRYSVNTPEQIAPLCDVLRKLSELGGKVVDTARGYGRSEEVIGGCVKEIGNRDQLFIATKFSLGGGRRGGAEAGPPPDPRTLLDLAFTRLQMDKIDLMMVHNLGGTETLLPLIRAHKQAGRMRYTGVSTSSDNAYETLIALMEKESLDFIQVDYSLGNRNAAERILPMARDKGIGVLINTPFDGRGGGLLQRLAGKPLPDMAREIDCTTWAQVCLKYVVSHPAVTAAIPGTTKVDHVIDNNVATRGRMPDEAMRRALEQHFNTV
jgi:aryl-alcohol dehydrogenase-like predicted oxidoreductase